MLTRRTLLRSAVLTAGLGATAPLLGACGQDGGMPGPGGDPRSDLDLVRADVPRTDGSEDAAAAVALAVAAFTADLYTQLAGDHDKNLVLSPYSVAMALAMTRNGAAGRTAREMDAVVHSEVDQLNDGLSWLDQALARRTGRRRNLQGKQGTVGLETANSLWGQQDTAWRESFLDTLARQYDTGMHQVDYVRDAEVARRQINAWTAAQTHGRITDLVPRGALGALTRLVLVNAIWLKAPWFEAFEVERTRDLPFRLLDGSRTSAPMMGALMTSASHAEGDGWRAVSLPYAGQELAMAVVVPDEDTALADVEARLAGGGLARLLGSFTSAGAVDVLLPRWTFRTNVQLGAALSRLGMPTAFTEAADFSAMTGEEQLLIDKVLHEGFVAVDEKGTEAAAATAVVMRTVSAPVAQHVVHADRPFLFVIHDVPTRLPLFIGRVTDPTG